MRSKLTLILLLGVLCNLSIAQIDQVAIKANYTHQTYYSLATGKSVSVPNDAWDLAFSNVGLQDAGVLYNESTALNGAQIKVFLANTTSWAEAITDTTMFVDSMMLLNPKKNWTEGAFNSVKASPSPFDYGWGIYNTMTNVVEGGRIYVIKKRDGSFIKFQVVKLVINDYSFRYANLDGSDEINTVVSKDKTNPNRLIHFSFNTGKVDMPWDFDLVFQRYKTPVPVGDGSMLDYNVTGVLLAPGVEAVVADNVDPLNVKEGDYAAKYSKNISTIGYDWKSFDLTSGWSIDDNRTQFIKTKKGDKFQITFYDYEGSATGITTLGRKVITTAVTDLIEDNTVNVYPNPTPDFITIDGIKEDSQLRIIDGSGKLVLKAAVTASNNRIGMNNLPSGNYILQLVTPKGIVSKQCIKI
jgi:hypothetical protein